MINEIEANSTNIEINLIDIQAIPKHDASKSAQFMELMAAAMSIEVNHLQELQRERHPQSSASQAPQIIAEPANQKGSGNAFAQQKNTLMANLAVEMERINQISNKVASGISTEIPIVRGEMDALVKKLGRDLKKGKMGEEQQVKQKAMQQNVLPTLSIPDQISELEHIIEGLNEHVFDSNQLEIIRDETLGLKEVLNNKPEYGIGASEDITMLRILRDKRLDEVLILLGNSV